MEEEIRPLSGNELIVKLKEVFDQYDFSTLKIKEKIIEEGIFIRYEWCEGINRFIEFLKRELRLSHPSSYHDTIKYLINRIFLKNNANLEVRRDKKRIDMVEKNPPHRKHEVKTLEYILLKQFRTKLSLLMKQATKQANLRNIWWICYLHQAKTIKGRVCVYFLGFITMSAARLKRIKTAKNKKEVLNQIISKQQELEKEIIEEEQIDPEELENEFLFGVENAVVSNLRADLINALQAEERIRKEKQQVEQEKQRVEQENEKIRKENEYLRQKIEELEKKSKICKY